MLKLFQVSIEGRQRPRCIASAFGLRSLWGPKDGSTRVQPLRPRSLRTSPTIQRKKRICSVAHALPSLSVRRSSLGRFAPCPGLATQVLPRSQAPLPPQFPQKIGLPQAANNPQRCSPEPPGDALRPPVRKGCAPDQNFPHKTSNTVNRTRKHAQKGPQQALCDQTKALCRRLAESLREWPSGHGRALAQQGSRTWGLHPHPPLKRRRG